MTNTCTIRMIDNIGTEENLERYFDMEELVWAYDNENRYMLGQIKKKPLICIGLNPSCATPFVQDETYIRVGNIAKRNGYDSFIMLNLCSLKKTKPEGLPEDYDNTKNVKIVNNILNYVKNRKEDYMILCAWGNNIEKHGYLMKSYLNIFEDTENVNPDKCKCLGCTIIKHHPCHPSRKSYDASLEKFSIFNYQKRYYNKFKGKE